MHPYFVDRMAMPRRQPLVKMFNADCETAYCWGELRDTLGLISMKVPHMPRDLRLRAISQYYLMKLGWPAAVTYLILTKNILDSAYVSPEGRELLRALSSGPFLPYHICPRLPRKIRHIMEGRREIARRDCPFIGNETIPQFPNLTVTFPFYPIVTVSDSALQRFARYHVSYSLQARRNHLEGKPTPAYSTSTSSYGPSTCNCSDMSLHNIPGCNGRKMLDFATWKLKMRLERMEMPIVLGHVAEKPRASKRRCRRGQSAPPI